MKNKIKKVRDKVNKNTEKVVDWAYKNPTSAKVIAGTAIGIIGVAVGYLLGNKWRKGK
ncbi:hypothetical protein KKG81_04675 [bacterium]|nr:hypothetical protein [bacterium]